MLASSDRTRSGLLPESPAEAGRQRQHAIDSFVSSEGMQSASTVGNRGRAPWKHPPPRCPACTEREALGGGPLDSPRLHSKRKHHTCLQHRLARTSCRGATSGSSTSALCPGNRWRHESASYRPGRSLDPRAARTAEEADRRCRTRAHTEAAHPRPDRASRWPQESDDEQRTVIGPQEPCPNDEAAPLPGPLLGTGFVA